MPPRHRRSFSLDDHAARSRKKDAAQYPGPVTFISMFVERPLRVMTALLRHGMSALRPIGSMFPVRAAIPKRPVFKQFMGHRSIFQGHAQSDPAGVDVGHLLARALGSRVFIP